MKTVIPIICLIILSSAGCQSKKIIVQENFKDLKNVEFIYKKYSRGFYNEISINKNRIRTYLNYEKNKFKDLNINPLQWQKCLSLANEIDLNKVNEIKDISNDRYSDKVHYGKLIIQFNKKQFGSITDFDHGNPPKEIARLTNYLLYLTSLDPDQN
tara:strand:- start:662 stop:1129 length:468 start_codon:yes stop_codon:yes gene_type:complete